MIEIFDKWAERLTEDCANAQHSIICSALSLLPPRHPTESPFSKLWQAWAAAAARGVRVEFFLAAPTKIHPATMQNITAGKIAAVVNMKTRYVPQPNLLHAKTVVIDQRTVWIGSGNFTAAAAHFNHELYCRFECEAIAARITSRWNNIANP